MTINLDALATAVMQAQDTAALMPPLSAGAADFDLDAAYAVAARVRQRRRAAGAVTVGRKIGFTNAHIWDEYGVRQPIWGSMYRHTVRLLDEVEAADDVSFVLTDLCQPRLEPEIVFGLGAAPAAGMDLPALAGCTAWVAHGFELVQSHNPGWRFQAADTVADGGLHGALIVGPRVPMAALGADPLAVLRTLQLSLWRDGQQVDAGSGANVLGSPLAALAHLVAVLAAQPGAEPLAAGEIVTTGTLTAAFPVQAGERWHTAVHGAPLAGLALRFTA